MGFVFLHKVRMQFEVVLSSANQDLVSCYLDPRSLDLAALQNILAESITWAVSFWRRVTRSGAQSPAIAAARQSQLFGPMLKRGRMDVTRITSKRQVRLSTKH